MKYILFVSLFLVCSPFYAQVNSPSTASTRTRAVISASNTHESNYQFQREYKERELRRLMLKYKTAPQQEQSIISSQMKASLYQIFDMSIDNKKKEADLLANQLLAMENNQAFTEKQDKIQYLQSALEKVENNLSFRKANRDRIVNQRLSELTK